MPIWQVRYPACLSTLASVHSAAGNPPPCPGNETVVMPLRIGSRPVIAAARPGVQLGWP